MSSRGPDLRPRARRAVAEASRFLTHRQDDDGLWRDYDLEPGRSDAWITGCVGHALLQGSSVARARTAGLHRAARALLASRRPAGWGYNLRAACDADSTSWVIRFLARMGVLGNLSATSILGAYITSTGAVRTFSSPEHFGSWATEHAEVTPLVGLALIAAGERHFVDVLRAAVLAARASEFGWRPFWWRSDTYAMVQSLEFLLASGGIPEHLATDERARLTRSLAPMSPFEAALSLAAAVHLRASQEALHLAALLVDMQSADGGWPPSAVLMVPDQRDASRYEIHSDDKRALGTAMAIIALRRWLQHEAWWWCNDGARSR